VLFGPMVTSKYKCILYAYAVNSIFKFRFIDAPPIRMRHIGAILIGFILFWSMRHRWRYLCKAMGHDKLYTYSKYNI